MTQIEGIKKGNRILKTVKTTVEGANDAKQELTFTITNGMRDRDFDVVNPDGMIADNFGANPIFTWVHDYTQPPVAKAVQLWKETNGNGSVIKARAAFQPDSNYDSNYMGIKGSMVYKMYKTGYLSAVSIGFNPIDWEPIEEKVSTLGGNRGTHFKSWDLLEVACVPVPANAGALVDRGQSSGFTKALRAWAQETKARCDACDDSDDTVYIVDEDMLNEVLNEFLEREKDEETFLVDEDTLNEVIDAYAKTTLSNGRY